MSEQNKRITDIGVPDYNKYLPPIIKKNYGKWSYHKVIKSGVLMHVAEMVIKYTQSELVPQDC